MIVYRTSRTCRSCGEPVGCMGRDWDAPADKVAPVVMAVDCEAGKPLEHCPHCGDDGLWWEEEEGTDDV